MPELPEWGALVLKSAIALFGWWLAAMPTGYLLGRFLKRFEQSAGESFTQGGLKHGGYWIGIGERTLIYLFILSGVPAAIGLLVAAKSIFRFGEIKDLQQRKLAEYILIGTLMSFTAATVVGVVTRLVIDEIS